MTDTFVRTRRFWALAGQVAVINFFMGGFSPAQPLLREDQGTSLAIAGLHGTALGVAAIFAGLTNSYLAHRFGRDKLTWIGLSIFGAGAVVFVFSPPVEITLWAIFFAGFGISTVINNTMTSASDEFSRHAHIAVAQINALAIVGFISGTLVIGTIATNFRGQWRLGLLITLPLLLILFIFGRQKDAGSHEPDEHGPQSGKLSRSYWLSWFGLFLSVSGEFATAFWSASLLSNRVGSTAALATLSLVSYGIGVCMGRWFAGRALGRFHADEQLLFALVFQFIAFGLFWSSHILPLSLVALFLVGIGVSVQFPLFSLRLIAFSDNRPDLAIGKSSLAAGVAIALAPLALGILGDNFGISRAYIMMPVLLIAAMAIVIITPSKKIKS
jgi:predicted MFS family arabinose efflux permease